MKKAKLYRGVTQKLSRIDFQHTTTVQHSHLLYASLFVCFAVVVASSLAIFPFLLAMASFPLYIIIAFHGIVFGLLFDFILYHATIFSQYHQLKAAALAFSTGFILFFLTTAIANSILDQIPISIASHNPFLLSLAYAISFALPFFYTRNFMLA